MYLRKRIEEKGEMEAQQKWLLSPQNGISIQEKMD